MTCDIFLPNDQLRFVVRTCFFLGYIWAGVIILTNIYSMKKVNLFFSFAPVPSSMKAASLVCGSDSPGGLGRTPAPAVFSHRH